MGGRRSLIAAVCMSAAAVAFAQEAHGTATIPRRTITHNAFYRVPTTEKVVALTFDDGPDPVVTPSVLALLQKYNAHATFFLTGEHALQHPDLVHREVAAGNEIGNHTWSHPILTRIGTEWIGPQIARADRVFELLGLPEPVLFRPPHGLASRRVLSRAAALGHRMALWSLALEHFTMNESIERAITDLLSRIRPGEIILAHDCCLPFDRTESVRALTQLIPLLQARGYRIVTVSELLGLGSVP
jgi:peptidoglycan/xylan/chitin deacetylase (PgdA/CDA1 family)